MKLTPPTLDLIQAQQVGARLKAAREALNLPSSKVANILLLSRHQVESLEIGDVSVFYNAQFYVQAADKYAVFLELTPAPSQTLFEQTEPVDTVPAVQASTGVVKPINPQARAARNRYLKLFLLLVGLVAMGAGAYIQRDAFVAQWPETKATPEKTKSLSEPVAPAEPIPTSVALPVSMAELPAPAFGTLTLTFNGSSWVQVVSANGAKEESTYKAGDTLTLYPEKLQAIVIGNAAAVSAESAKGTVSLNAYVATGSKVARIVGSAVRALGR